MVLQTHQIDANLVVGADDTLALVDIVLASQPVETFRAFAVEIVARISLVLGDYTLAPVLTGLLHARVVSPVASPAHELWCTRASEVVDL